jgi:fermentation-respiration switch protein FrsA (DUF1100 family)
MKPDEKSSPKKRRYRFMGIVYLALFALVLFYGALYFLQDQMVFPATQDPDIRTPAPWESVDLTTEDGVKIHGWLALQENAKEAPTLLYFHGNAGHIGFREDIVYSLHRKTLANIFIFDYRGYGRSEGSPSRKGLIADAKAALQYLKSLKSIDPEKIVYLGDSLGGAVALELAVLSPPKGLILKSTFTSIQEMAPVPVPFFLIKHNFNSIALMPQIQCPKLFFHGNRDQMIPFEQGKRLYEVAQGDKAFHVLEGADHNDPDTSFFYMTIAGFLKKLFPEVGQKGQK